MPMIWDSPLTAAVARELDARLAGTRLRGHVFRWEDRELALYFREGTLRWSLHPLSGWVILDPPEELPDGARRLAAEVLSVEAPPDERWVRFRLKKIRGRTRALQIVVELMTNQWNALVAEGDEGWIRHILWAREAEGRSLTVGRAYQPPEPSRRAGIGGDLPEDAWRSLLRRLPEESREEGILESLAHTSSLNLAALIGGPPGSGEPAGTQEPDYRLWARLGTLEALEPCVLDTPRGRQPYPVILPTFPHHPYPTVLDAIRAAFLAGVSSDGTRGEIMERLDRLIHDARGRVRGVAREMDQAGDPHTCRERANLLLARLGEVKRGAPQVTLKGFLGEEVTLELDPTLSPHENADALFQEAARRERALEKLPALLRKATEQLEELSRLREDLAKGRARPEDVQDRLPAPTGKSRWQGGRPPPRLPFKRFRSSGGLEIRVGRGSRENDDLTFRHSHPDDVWLHAREAGGAHVILRWTPEESPPTRDLTEAAVLAALHSGGRSARVVPVDWTRRKYVRKPRKAPPGTVTVQNARTVFVEPDPTLADTLSWDR